MTSYPNAVFWSRRGPVQFCVMTSTATAAETEVVLSTITSYFGLVWGAGPLLSAGAHGLRVLTPVTVHG